MIDIEISQKASIRAFPSLIEPGASCNILQRQGGAHHKARLDVS